MIHHWKDAVKLVYVGHYYSAQQKFYVHIYEGKKLFLLAEIETHICDEIQDSKGC